MSLEQWRAAHLDELASCEHELETWRAGTKIEVVWSGGNGPHIYTLGFGSSGIPYAQTAGVDPYYNPLTFVGRKRFHTQVRKQT